MKRIICFLFIIITCISFSFVYADTNFNINSKSAVAMDLDSGIVLYSKNMNDKVYPASTTKILVGANTIAIA